MLIFILNFALFQFPFLLFKIWQYLIFIFLAQLFILVYFIPNIDSSYSTSLIMRTKSFRFRMILFSLFSSINSLLIKFSRFDEVTIHLNQIKTRPAPWMARPYNPVGRAREARLQNICLTCKRELARFRRQASSRNRDKRVYQVEAVVRFLLEIQYHKYSRYLEDS